MVVFFFHSASPVGFKGAGKVSVKRKEWRKEIGFPGSHLQVLEGRQSVMELLAVCGCSCCGSSNAELGAGNAKCGISAAIS